MTDLTPPPAPTYAAAVPPPLPSYYGTATGAGTGRATEVTAFAIVAFVVAAGTTAMGVLDAVLSGHVVREGGVHPGDADPQTAIWGLAAVLLSAGLLAGLVTGALWLYRARANAAVLVPHYPFTRSLSWAWGGWICPVVFLWFPYQVVRDVRGTTSERATPRPLVGWWFTLWLTAEIGDRIRIALFNSSVHHPEDAHSVEVVSLIWAAVLVGALVLWGLLLLRITTEQNAAVRAGGRSTAPA